MNKKLYINFNKNATNSKYFAMLKIWLNFNLDYNGFKK